MEAFIVVFHLPEGTPRKIHNRFRQKIYGEDTSSWGGRYRYHRKGVLDDLPHNRLYWGVVIIRKSHYKRIKEILDEYGAIVEKRVVICTKGDILKLKKALP